MTDGPRFDFLTLPNGVRVYASMFMPAARYPTRWEMWRWRYWASESPVPEPYDTVYLLPDGSNLVSVKMFAKMAAAMEVRPS